MNPLYIPDFAPEISLEHCAGWDWVVSGRSTRTLFSDREGMSYDCPDCRLLSRVWPEWVQKLRERIRTRTGIEFILCLPRRYPDRSWGVGWHRDAPIHAPVIATVSVGTARMLQLRAEGHRSQGILLEHGSLLVFDSRQEHRLPAAPGTGERVALIFRGGVIT